MRNSIFAKLWIFLRTIPYWKLWIRKGHCLFLDDIRVPRDVFKMSGDFAYLDKSWVVVRNYNQFVGHIIKCHRKGMMPRVVGFDHDLGLEHTKWYFEHGGHANPPNPITANFTKTGYDCAKFLVEFCMDNKIRLPTFKVHSQNPCGRDKIYGLLNNFKRHQEQNGLES